MKKKVFWNLFLFLLGFCCLVYLVLDYGPQKLLLDLVSFKWFFVLLVLSFVPTLALYSLAWMLLTDINPRLPIFRGRNFLLFFKMMTASIAWNNLTPFLKIGGEPLKIFMLKNWISHHKSVTSTLLYNLVHTYATLLSFIIVLLLSPFLFPLSKFYKAVSFSTGIIGVLLFLISYFWINSKFEMPKKMIGLRYSWRKGKIFLKQHPRRGLMALFFEVCARFIEGLTFWLAFYLLNNPISLVNSTFLDVGRTLIDTLFFFIPYQVGSREQGTQIIIEQIMHLSSKGYLGAVMAYRLVEITWAMIGLTLYYSITKSSSKRGKIL